MSSTYAPALAATRATFERLRRILADGAAAVEQLPVPAVLAGLIAVEWACVLALARTVRHAGWIYYQGGDQLWYYSLGWLQGHGEIGKSLVGYGWPAMLAPLARIAGPNLVSALPAIILFNVLVLLPIAMLALYGIAARLGGRLFGYWTLLLWIAVPFIGIAYTNVGYHQKYTELLLPQALGLTALADFPTTVATLVSAYFCTRVLFTEHPRLLDALAAGVAAGAAIGIKPATALFLLGPALAFAYRRRVSSMAMFAAGLAPALLALAVWKQRGLGGIPAFGNSYAAHRLAAGITGGQPIAGIDFGRYLRLNWSHLGNNLDLLREHFWSGRVLQWLVIAGIVGIARQSRTALLLVGGWFAAFVLVKGSYVSASIEDGSVFRIMMPAFPAFILGLASIPLLLPHAPQRLRPWAPGFREFKPRTRLTFVAVAILVSSIVPLAAFAAARKSGGPANVAQLGEGAPAIPVDVDLGLTAQARRDGRVALRWVEQKPPGGPVFYRVWRGPASGGDGVTCQAGGAARACILALPEIGATRSGAYIDKPGKGRWLYRIAVAANWLDDPAYGDPYLVSSPVRVITR
jgi:hypothetical protein